MALVLPHKQIHVYPAETKLAETENHDRGIARVEETAIRTPPARTTPPADKIHLESGRREEEEPPTLGIVY